MADPRLLAAQAQAQTNGNTPQADPGLPAALAEAQMIKAREASLAQAQQAFEQSQANMSKSEASARRRILSAIHKIGDGRDAGASQPAMAPIPAPENIADIATEWIGKARKTTADGETRVDMRNLAQKLKDLASIDPLKAKLIAAELTAQSGGQDVNNHALAWHLKPLPQKPNPQPTIQPTPAAAKKPNPPERSSHEQKAVDRGTQSGRLEAAKEWGGEVVDGLFATMETGLQLGVVGANEVPIVGLLIPDSYAGKQEEDLQKKLQALEDTIKSIPELPQAIQDKYDAEIGLAQELEKAYDEGRADISVLEEAAKIRSKADAELAILGLEIAAIGAGGVGAGTKAARIMAKIDNGFPGGLKGAIDAGRDLSSGLARDIGELPQANSSFDANVLKRLKEGRQFNLQNAHRYEFNEITLENGKRVDSINLSDGTAEIVSRKNTQLADVQPSTATSYLNELATKYPPEELIPATPKNIDLGIDGKRLAGPQILEVPVQDAPVPQAVLDKARSLNIIIRDIDGTIYR